MDTNNPNLTPNTGTPSADPVSSSQTNDQPHEAVETVDTPDSGNKQENIEVDALLSDS